jgi:hypothetical protein
MSRGFGFGPEEVADGGTKVWVALGAFLGRDAVLGDGFAGFEALHGFHLERDPGSIQAG